MVTLAIDSASKSGWALLDGEKVVSHGLVNATERTRIDALAAFVCSKTRPALVAIEDNYFGVNVDVVKVLSRIVGAWELAFAVRGVPTELVMASTWQRALLTGLITNASKSAERKKACARWVEATHKIKVSEDEADAIAMGTWIARREMVARRLAGVGAIPRAAI